jgi:hypothetical protein
MSISKTVLGLTSSLALLSNVSVAPAVSSAATVDQTYVACNQYDQCWRVHKEYNFSGEKIVYHEANWYDAHKADEHVHWVSDPSDDRGYYMRDGTWHSDPAGRAIVIGATGAGIGAAIGCLATLVVGCAPGAAVGAAIGGGVGAAAGAASTPDH